MDEFIRAVHYFGEQWPLNFWSSFTMANVPGDFSQIRRDGFNCIILLLPLRMFLPRANAVTKDYERRFRFLLAEAEKAGLWVILRIAYPQEIVTANIDIGPRAGLQMCDLLHQSDKTYQFYIEHLGHVKSLIGQSHNVKFVFLSWEDSWCVMKSFPDLDAMKRKMLSKRLGFDRFIKETVPEEMQKILAIASPDIVPIPNKTDPLFAIFKQFYDRYVYDRFIAPLEATFPNAAYEQRVDGQKVIDYKGGEQWLQFDGYRDKKVACFSYWAPFMGQVNAGQFIGADAAMQSLRRVEGRIRGKAGRKHFIDQFNFVNGTAEFTATAAKINPAERTAFLAAALDYLKETTLGYGLWAYHDYRENYIVNGTFELGLYNWEIEGTARVAGDGPYWLAIEGRCKLKTEVFANRRFNMFVEHYGSFQLTFELDRPIVDDAEGRKIDIVASIFGTDYPVSLITGSARQSVPIVFDYADKLNYRAPLEIRIGAPEGMALKIRDFQFFNHVLSNGLYGVDNRSSPSMDAIRRFNHTVSSGSRVSHGG